MKLSSPLFCCLLASVFSTAVAPQPVFAFPANGRVSADAERALDDSFVAFRAGDHAKALSLGAEAERLYRIAKDEAGLGYALLQTASFFGKLHQSAEASNRFRAAQSLFRRLRDNRGLGSALVIEAEFLLDLYEEAEAEKCLNEATRLFTQLRDSQALGNLFLLQGKLYEQKGLRTSALDAFRRARGYLESVGDLEQVGVTWVHEGHLLLDRENREEPARAYRKAAEIFREAGSWQGVSESLNGLAILLLANSQWLEAAKTADDAAEAARRAGAVSNEVAALQVASLANVRLDKLQQALDQSEAALRLFNRRRQALLTTQGRIEADQRIQGSYRMAVQILFMQGRFVEALQRIEESRSRVLLDLVAGGLKSLNEDRTLAGRAKELEKHLARLERELTVDPWREATAEQRAEVERERRQQAIRRIREGVDPLGSAAPMTAEEIRALTHDVGPVLVFFVAGSKILSFLLGGGPEWLQASEIPMKKSVLESKVLDFSSSLANPIEREKADSLAKELFAALLGPWSKETSGWKTLVVVGHDILHQVPFEALRDSTGEFPFQKTAISMAPSLSVLRELRAHRKQPWESQRFVLIEGGDSGNVAAAEIGALGRLVWNRPSEVVSIQDASKDQFSSQVPLADQVLISAQGVWEEGDQERTYLRVRPTAESDSRLTAVEIAAQPIRAELVVLAACDGARGKALFSDERLDLSRAFLMAGAGAVLTTRWKIPDDPTTTQFVVDFYQAYLGAGSGSDFRRKDEALMMARERSRRRGDLAQLWAAWVLVGDGR
jgi:CHAT domain-containing protein